MQYTFRRQQIAKGRVVGSVCQLVSAVDHSDQTSAGERIPGMSAYIHRISNINMRFHATLLGIHRYPTHDRAGKNYDFFKFKKLDFFQCRSNLVYVGLLKTFN